MKAARAFVAVDGEGVTRHRARLAHDYVLLAASDGAYVERTGPGGLSSGECFTFLLDLAERHAGASLVIFGGTYDFECWLRDLDPERIGELVDGRYITCRPGNGRCYRVRVINRHEFYVSEGYWSGGAWRKHRSASVWDVIGWFQSSFVEAVEHWRIGSAAERRRLADMKARRAVFRSVKPSLVRAYCLSECRMLAEMMDHVSGVLADQGIRPARWDGAGAGAAALLRKHETRREIARPAAAPLNDAIMRGYFGGRAQSFVSGIMPGPTWCYDLHGAYVWAASELPALMGTWERGEPAPGDASLSRVTYSTDGRLTPFPHRVEGGAIYWPQTGEGWYWDSELIAAGLTGYTYDVRDQWRYRPGDPDARPFRWLAEWYAERLRRKHAGDPAERPMKLVGAAVYGKIVQAARAHGMPPNQSYIWGGMITAHVRARMLAAAAAAGDDLVAIATDAIFSRRRLPLPLGDGLGDWAETVIEPGLCVVQAGVMIAPSARFVRSRGFGPKAISYRELAEAWRSEGFFAECRTQERRFITAQYALFTGHPETWRTWQTFERTIGFSLVPAAWPRADYFARRGRRTFELLYPPATPDVSGDGWALSAPYEPRKMRDHDELQYEAMLQGQPDVDMWSGIVG